jgi:NADH:ubiquinone oxidoreductase subunit E
MPSCLTACMLAPCVFINFDISFLPAGRQNTTVKLIP